MFTNFETFLLNIEAWPLRMNVKFFKGTQNIGQPLKNAQILGIFEGHPLKKVQKNGFFLQRDVPNIESRSGNGTKRSRNVWTRFDVPIRSLMF